MSVGPVLAGRRWVTGHPTEPPGPRSDLPVDGSTMTVVELVWPLCWSWNTVQHRCWTRQGELQGYFWIRTSKFVEWWWILLRFDLTDQD